MPPDHPCSGCARWMRLSAQSLAGTEGATYPFWSPDSRFIAFLAQGKLKKIDVSGGAPVTLCDASLGATGAWNRDDVILFTPKGGAPLYRVSASGGTPSPVTTVDTASGGDAALVPLLSPRRPALPLFCLGRQERQAPPTRAACMSARSIQKRQSTLLLQDGSHAKYAEGYLIYMRGSTLMARPFDANRREFHGEAEPLAEQLQTTSGSVTGAAGAFTVSETGVLAYQTGSGVVRSQLRLVRARRASRSSVLGDQADYSRRRAVAGRSARGRECPRPGTRDSRLVALRCEARAADALHLRFGERVRTDLVARRRSTRLCAEQSRVSISIRSHRAGRAVKKRYWRAVWASFRRTGRPDGRFILYMAGGAAIARSDLLVLPLFGDKKPFPFLESSFVETRGRFSPDGRWIAYASNESGQLEIYVARFPEPGERRRVSTAGGLWPRWRRDGKEIVYLAPDNTLTAATVNGEGANFEVGAVRTAVRGASSPHGHTRRLSVRRLRRRPALSRQHSGRRDGVGGHHTCRELDGWTEEMTPTTEESQAPSDRRTPQSRVSNFSTKAGQSTNSRAVPSPFHDAKAGGRRGQYRHALVRADVSG